MARKTVKMHKDDLGDADVLPVQVEGLKRHGWTLVDDGSSESGQENAPEGQVEGNPDH